MYARAGYGQAPYGGTVLPAPDVGAIPPPIPGDPTSFTYAAQLGAYPWAYVSWAGGYPLASYPGGGILATPRPDLGVVELRAWWPGATAVQLVRIGPDGSRTPVRGGYPLTTTAPTRRNLATNPSLEAGLNGYVAADGNPTLTRVAGGSSGSWSLRATTTDVTGWSGVTVPTATLTDTTPVTVAFGLRLSIRPTVNMRCVIAWTDALGGALTATTITYTADEVAASVNQWNRPVRTITPPTGAVTPTVKIVAQGMPVGSTMDLDAVTLETATTDGSFFDGRSLGGSWTGAVDLSTSVLAPIQTILDGACPLDVPVTYQVSYPGITGGRVVSEPTVLASLDQSWLTHPAAPSTPIQCRPTAAPNLTRGTVQATFTVIGRTNPVVVTSQRLSPTGTLTLDTATFAERDQLLALLADGAPLLLRAPADYGLGPGWWLAVGDITEDPDGRPQWLPTRAITLPFTVVDAPAVT